MNIVKPGYEIIFMSDPRIIERMGRIAYKSEYLIAEDSCAPFIRKIVGLGHDSVLEHSMMSVIFTTDRGISHEIVRHRLASYTQSSTRYCNYSKNKFGNEISVIRPSGIIAGSPMDQEWMDSTMASEKAYMAMLEFGASPQVARASLPTCLMTEIGMTANFREWRHFFQLRAISNKAHPDMRLLAIPLYLDMRCKYPEIFDLGDPE